MRLFERQAEAWKLLMDDVHTEIVYWWWAGWGKSKLWSFWLWTQIAEKPWSTWCIARSELKKIKLSTLITFRQVLKELGFDDESYRYDDQKWVMTFVNGCKVVLMDLNYNPSDPEFDRLWSMEFTGVFIDEAQEIDDKARQIISSRIRNLYGETLFYTRDKEEAERYIEKNNRGILHYNEQLGEYHVVLWVQNAPKLFMSCNPWRNFIYTDFYKPSKEGTILPYRFFVQSLPKDNPFLPKSYIQNLEHLDKTSRERLLYGNFDYSDDPWLLFLIDDLDKCFTKSSGFGAYYITIDAARQGRDNTVIWIWQWLSLIDIKLIKKGGLEEQKRVIDEYIKKYDVSINNVIVDEVGVGGGLVDMLWCKWFIANAAPLHPYSAKLLSYKKRNYANLKTQAFFYLKKYIEEWKLTINADGKMKEDIIEELLFIRQIDIDNDSKIKLEGKRELKERLWRSPDLADMISFRMWWIIKEHHEWNEIDEDKKTKKEIEQDEFLKFLMEDDEEEEKEFDISVY